jgi:SpoVK/Ycf46/Vps4 family AAA+-type ATPase
MHSVLRSSIVSISRTSTKLICRRISNRRFPQSSRSFHQAPRLRASEGEPNKTDTSTTDENAQSKSNASRSEGTITEKNDCTALSAPAVKDLAHYGSAARRSQRSRSQRESNRETDGQVTPSVRIPEWFVENNVFPVEENEESRISLLRWNAERAEYMDIPRDAQFHSGDAPGMEPLGDNETSAALEAPDSTPSKDYFVDSLQWEELVSTARGLMKLTESFVADDLASRKNHLILHYAGEGGDYLLDELIRRLASELRADTVVVDALDIADLACEPHNAFLSEDAADDRRLISYDVYEAPPSELRRGEEQPAEAQEEEDVEAETMRPTTTTVFLDVRGSPLDFSNSGSSRGRRWNRPMMPTPSSLSHLSSFLSEKPRTDADRARAASQRMVPLVEAFLAGPFLRRTMRSAESGEESSKKPQHDAATQQVDKPLILEIRDIKLIQQTAFGQKLLTMLYDHVQSRRRKGQKIIIIGTDAFAKADQYSADNIRNLQSEPPGNISRTMVITPVVPSKDALVTLREDKKKRTRTINMRHLWQMLCIKLPELYMKDDVRLKWTWSIERSDSKALYGPSLIGVERRIWAFDKVHRLATMIVGRLESGATDSISQCSNEACMNMKGSDNSKIAWTEQQQATRTKSKPDIERAESQRLDKIRKKLTKYEKKLVGGVIEPQKISTTFAHVHAPLDTIDALKTLTTLSLVRPEAFKYGVLASDKIPGLLLYGPPGTGKTLLAKAVAKESGATVLEVSGAELNDMYVGEGEKNVRALFSLAKKLTPCVVFIDEADAVFSARGSGQRRVSHREILNQFLREWDGMSNDAGSAFIMVATNRPFDLDDAVLRRLPRRLLVDLPSENDRLEILKIHLKDEKLAEDVSLLDLAAKTPFYSGSDLKNLSVAAALNCVREENEKAKNHEGEEAYEYAEKRILTAAHFERALEDISASISEDMGSLKAIKKFDEQYGDKRGKKKKSAKWGFTTASEADKPPDTVKVRN